MDIPTNDSTGSFKSSVVCSSIGNNSSSFGVLHGSVGSGKAKGMLSCSPCALNVVTEDRVCYDNIFFLFNNCCTLLHSAWIDVCNVCNFLKYTNQ